MWLPILNRASDILQGHGAAKFRYKCAKPHEVHKNTQNSLEVLSNTCQYNIFKTYLSYGGFLIAVNFQIYLETSSPQWANIVPKLPGVICCEKLGTSHDVKSFAILAQKNSQALCREENFHEISCFLLIVFWQSLIAPKILRNQPVFPRIYLCKICLFFLWSIRSPALTKFAVTLKFY